MTDYNPIAPSSPKKKKKTDPTTSLSPKKKKKKTNPTTSPSSKRKKKTNPTTSPSPPLLLPPSLSSSFSSIPNEVIVNCLARISKSHYRSLCLVSKNFYSILSSPEIYTVRSELGATEPRLYVRLKLPTINHHSWFTVRESEGELSLAYVRPSSSYFPDRLNSTTVVVGYEIYQIGGSNEDKRTRAVRVLDCRSHTWRHAPDMKIARKYAKSYFLDGKIYVIGGCTVTAGIKSWGEVFDIKTQTWNPFPNPFPKPPIGSGVYVHLNHKVAVLGGRLYVFTKNDNKSYAYDPKEGRWVPEVGVAGLERMTRPWCVIGDVMFAEHDDGLYKCYDPRSRKWIMVRGLNTLYAKRGYTTIHLVNHGGKLVIFRHEWRRSRHHGNRIWCAVIRLEKYLTTLGPTLWGEVEHWNVVLETVPGSYRISSCQSVSL